MEELLNILGIKKNRDVLKGNLKMQQFYNYIKETDADVYEHGFDIDGKAFLLLLTYINSFKTLLGILKRSNDLLGINYNPKQMALFYNLYDYNLLSYNEDNEFLIDEEYLSYASVWWTENKLLKEEKLLYICSDKLMLRSSKAYGDVPSYLVNIRTLKMAKEKNLLKEAIMKITKDLEK